MKDISYSTFVLGTICILLSIAFPITGMILDVRAKKRNRRKAQEARDAASAKES